MKISTKKKKIIVVMPAYNAEKTLERTYKDIPKKIISKVILVDDGSHDKTVKKAKKLRIKTIVHPQNRGYGGNQKTCYTEAVSDDADIVVMIHPDYQYDATKTPEMVMPIIKGEFDIMLGSRIRTRGEALAGGMPPYKYFSNRLLTILENVILGQNLSEYHTGFRAYKRNVLKVIPFHKFSDDFVFDQHFLISAIDAGFKVGETPVPVRYFKEASSINFWRSSKYGIEIILALSLFMLHKISAYHSPIFVFKK